MRENRNNDEQTGQVTTELLRSFINSVDLFITKNNVSREEMLLILRAFTALVQDADDA